VLWFILSIRVLICETLYCILFNAVFLEINLLFQVRAVFPFGSSRSISLLHQTSAVSHMQILELLSQKPEENGRLIHHAKDSHIQTVFFPISFRF